MGHSRGYLRVQSTSAQFEVDESEAQWRLQRGCCVGSGGGDGGEGGDGGDGGDGRDGGGAEVTVLVYIALVESWVDG